MNGLRFDEAGATLRLLRNAMLLQNMAVRSFFVFRCFRCIEYSSVGILFLLSLVFVVLCSHSFPLYSERSYFQSIISAGSQKHAFLPTRCVPPRGCGICSELRA